MFRTSLATHFRKVVGVSVQAYITKVRLTLAASLLERPNRPKLAQIAAMVGYISEATLNRAFVATLSDPGVRKQLTDLGVDVAPGTSEEFRAYIKSEIPKWARIVKASGAKID